MSVSGFLVSLFGLAFSIPAFSVTPVLTRVKRVVGSCPHFYQTFKMLWQILRADNVCGPYALISLLYKQLLQYTLLKSFTVTPALLTEFPEKFYTKLLASALHFHKIVHENTFALTPLCFIWVSRAIAKHARIVLTAFCQYWRFVVNVITEI